MVPSADKWSRREAAGYLLKPKSLVVIVLSLVLSIVGLGFLGVESRVPWILAATWILVTPLLMRIHLMTRSEFDRAEYLSNRNTRERNLDTGVSLLGNAIGVGSMVGLYLVLGLYPESTVLFSEPRTIYESGIWFGVLNRSVVLVAFGFVGAQVAFFLRAKQFYERGATSFFGWPFTR